MRLNLYDKDLNRIRFIDENFISCLWAENYNSSGKFTIELPLTEENKKNVKPDTYVGRWDRKTIMVIKSVTADGERIIATGSTADRQLDDVAFIGTITENSIAAAAIKTAYNNCEKYPHIEIEASDLPDRYISQISNKSMREILEKICQGADIGYRAEKDGNEIKIRFYKPEANENLKFSREYGNLQDFSLYSSTEAEKNHAIILGSGEGDDRAKAEIDLRTDTSIQKRSVIIDARDMSLEEGETQDSYKQRLIERGAQKLMEYQKIHEVNFTPRYALGVDFELGDILTALLNDYNIKIRSRVTGFTQKQQNNQTTTTIELGEKQTLTSATTQTSGTA